MTDSGHSRTTRSAVEARDDRNSLKADIRWLGHHPQYHEPATGAAGMGLLKYHVVGNPHYRGNVLVLQTMHNTAVLVERATKVEWVLDVWPRGYAQPPDVITVEKWVTEY
jgi:hypothetical protein